MRYIQRFDSASTEQAAIDAGQLGKPYIAFIEDGQYIDWNTKEATPDYSGMPMTFDFISGGTVYFDLKVANNYETFGYKVNNGEWISPSSNTFSFEVNDGDKVAVRGKNAAYGYGGRDTENPFFSGSSGVTYRIFGNVMSVIDYDNFTTLKTLGDMAFTHFLRYSNVVDASNLIFPATNNVGEDTYYGFFRNCEILETGPKVLPGGPNVLARGYKSMFEGCHMLRTVPIISATIWGQQAAEGMFNECYSLAETPQLTINSEETHSFHVAFKSCSSLTRVDNIVFPKFLKESYSMFKDCTNLSYMKCLSKIITVDSGWMNGVAASGTFVKHPDAIWQEGKIPSGWTVVDADV